MKFGRLNHVAIAYKQAEQASHLFKSLGYKALPEHGVYTIFVELPNVKLELLEPLGDKSPIAGFLNKNPAGGIHHFCYEVSDLEKAIDIIKKQGIRLLNETPKIGAHGKPVVFLHPKDCNGILTELEQE